MFVINYPKSQPDYNRYVYYFQISDVSSFLNYSLNSYFNLKNDSLQIIEYPENKNVMMSVRYLSGMENKVI